MITQPEQSLGPGWSRLIHRYWTLCKISFQERMEYRFNIFLYLSMVLVPALISIYLWSSVFNTRNNPEMVRNISTYYLVATFVNWRIHQFHWNIMFDVLQGQLATFFLRPMSYPAKIFWYEVGGRTWSTLLTLPVFGLMAVLMGPNFKPPASGWDWLWAIAAFSMGFVLNFFITATLGLITIWQPQSESFFVLFQVVSNGLGGALVPLALMPWGIGQWLQWLPFAYIYSLPVRIFQGLPPEAIAQGMVVQLVWIGLFALVFNRAWAIAVRRYEVYEG